MNKRGQITVFIILGIVIVAIIAFLYIASQRDIIPSIIPTRIVSIKDNVESCIKEKGTEVINIITKQGGSLDPGLYQPFCSETKCDKIAYLCYTDNFTACVNRQPFLISHMEDEITSYMQENLDECINDFSVYENNGYKVEAGSYQVKTTVGRKNVIIVLDYPIKITKGDVTQQENRFSETFNYPLGRLTEVAKDIVESEIEFGDFLVVPYITKIKGEVEITKILLGRTKVYMLRTRDNPRMFQFAVRGWVY